MKINETSTAFFEYKDNFLTITIKEDVEIDTEQMQEQVKLRKEMVDNEPFVILVDSRSFHSSTKEAREYISKIEDKNWLGMAVLVNSLPTRLITNFFIRMNKPFVDTKMFTDKSTAIKWLNLKLNSIPQQKI